MTAWRACCRPAVQRSRGRDRLCRGLLVGIRGAQEWPAREELPCGLFHWVCAFAAASLLAVPAAAQQWAPGELAARSLDLLRASAQTYVSHRDCFSCHHQALPLWVHAAAGTSSDNAGFLQSQAAFSAAWFAVRSPAIRRGHGVPGGPYTAGYALLTLAAAGMAEDATADDLVVYLLATQEKDGRWSIRTHRPPLEDSDFTATALAVRGLRVAASAAQADDVDERIARASRWLAAHAAHDGEGLAYRLLGLAWSEVDEVQVAEAAALLVARQRDDGGWAQVQDLPSDAYATGQALAALCLSSALSPRHAAYQRGLAWLARRQLADGSWHVASRSRPFQEYFESGFPHGPDQFISAAATSWAVLAMLPARALDPAQAAQAQRLPALLVARLLLMHEVARWKWIRQHPIFDPHRERQLLTVFTRQAAQRGIEPHRARRFLRAQLAAARSVQQADFENWESEPAVAPHEAADLESDVRPKIDALTAELAPALAAWDRLEPAAQRAALEQAIAAAAQEHLPSESLEAAFAPLQARDP